jgi:uncharacterized membrane protein YeiH
MTIWQLLDGFGVFVFALSGGLAAARRNMDLFGVAFIAMLPAIGGGTVRDLVLGLPVFWVAKSLPLLLVAAAAALVFLFAGRVERRRRLIEWCDAVGLAVFCVLGARRALLVTDEPGVAVMMGVITAVLGGVLRDVVCNEIPLVLHREIYATAAVLGAGVYVVAHLLGLNEGFAMATGAGAAFGLRAMALLFGLSLPRPPGPERPPRR